MTVIEFPGPARVGQQSRVTHPVSTEQLIHLRAVGWLADGYVSTKLVDETLRELQTALEYACDMRLGGKPNDPAIERLASTFAQCYGTKSSLLRDAHACVERLLDHVAKERDVVITLPNGAYPAFDVLLIISFSALLKLFREQCEEEQRARSRATA